MAAPIYVLHSGLPQAKAWRDALEAVGPGPVGEWSVDAGESVEAPTGLFVAIGADCTEEVARLEKLGCTVLGATSCAGATREDRVKVLGGLPVASSAELADATGSFAVDFVFGKVVHASVAVDVAPQTQVAHKIPDDTTLSLGRLAASSALTSAGMLWLATAKRGAVNVRRLAVVALIVAAAWRTLRKKKDTPQPQQPLGPVSLPLDTLDKTYPGVNKIINQARRTLARKGIVAATLRIASVEGNLKVVDTECPLKEGKISGPVGTVVVSEVIARSAIISQAESRSEAAPAEEKAQDAPAKFLSCRGIARTTLALPVSAPTVRRRRGRQPRQFTPTLATLHECDEQHTE
mmetsp:Transcript_21392/g.52579  ORF Transcript_21392/g.52579 Transcript_21392/m.52579 type:complete len:349 (+) Transcript_21392:56-1102(+)